jgi:pilus assembly protein CpaE
MTLAVNQGVPLVIAKRDLPTSKDIFALAKLLSSGLAAKTADAAKKTEKAPEKTGLFGKLMARR